MKKVLSVLLAMIIALSCTAIAFAADVYTCPTCKKAYTDIAEYNACIEKHNAPAEDSAEATLTCPYCNNKFADESAYNEHISICYGQNAHYNNAMNLSASQILDKLVEIFDINANWWDAIEDVIIRLVDLIENIGSAIVSKADVAGAVDELEAKVADLGIVGDILVTIKNLITSLKQKIKDLYAGNKETEIVETTATETVSTGSSAIGIAAFAAVSVASAAAYVCTKKKEA